MEDFENEKKLHDYPLEVNIEKTETILKQLKHSVCKIYNQQENGSGFFCKISFHDGKKPINKNVLITCNHILGEKDLIKGNKINLSFFDGKVINSFILDDKRIIFTNVEYDITIIEIKSNDPIINYECLEINENVFSNADLNYIFRNKPIYTLHNPYKKTLVSYGKIKQIYDNNIDHYCNTKKGSSGGPILSLDDNKVIGIHKGSYKKETDEFNKGILISGGINEFLKYLNFQKNFKMINNIYIKKKNNVKEKDKISLFSKNTILEKKSFIKDYEKISLQTEANIIRHEILDKYNNIIEKEFLFNNFEEIPSINRISLENEYNLRNKDILRSSSSNEDNPFKKSFVSSKNNNNNNNNNNNSNNKKNYNNHNKSKDKYYLMDNNINISSKINFGKNNNINNKEIIFGEEEFFVSEYRRIIFKNGILFGIIKRYDEIKNIVNKIQLIFKKDVKFNLMYKATEIDDKASTFHQICDYLNGSLVIIETNKGVRFGGFTTKNWKGNCIKKVDNDAFVFSIDNNKIYNVYKNDFAIGGYPKFGPIFFGCQIRIYDNFFSRKCTTCLKGLNYSTTKDYELNNGEQYYIVKDIEIYSIEK